MPTIGRMLRHVIASLLAATLAFGVAGLLVPRAALATTLVCSASNWVNVRTGPGTSYPILGRLLRGQSIQSRGTATASGWTPVTFNGRNAYVSSTYVSLPAMDATPRAPIAGYAGVQLTNALLVIRAGQAMGLDDWTVTVGVMTAMGESSLRNVNYGDKAGPDSRGLFQQRANGAWGSYSDRMNPTTAATNFFKALLRVPNYRTLTPTLAAHRTQRNRDPNHYTKYWPAAVSVYQALGQAPAALAQQSGGSGALAAVNLNVRTGAGFDFAIDEVVPRGTTLVITGRTLNGFSEVSKNGQSRWVYTKYLTLDSTT